MTSVSPVALLGTFGGLVSAVLSDTAMPAWHWACPVPTGNDLRAVA